MKTTDFRGLKEIERKAVLCGVLAKKTEGKLSQKQIKMIVDNIDLSNQYSIVVLNDAKEFGKKVKLKEKVYEENTVCDSYQEKGNVLLGKLEFGKLTDISGTQEYENEKEAIFDIFDVIAVSVEAVDSYRDFKWSQNNSDNRKNYLYIYIPSSEPYKLDDRVKELIEAFDVEVVEEKDENAYKGVADISDLT